VLRGQEEYLQSGSVRYTGPSHHAGKINTVLTVSCTRLCVSERLSNNGMATLMTLDEVPLISQSSKKDREVA
jgi:hypothetical protein